MPSELEFSSDESKFSPCKFRPPAPLNLELKFKAFKFSLPAFFKPKFFIAPLISP